LDLIDDAFWHERKQQTIEFFESTCRLKEITILAHTNPDTLLYYDLVDSTCIFYRDALIAGGDEMLDAWIVLHNYQMIKNGLTKDKEQQQKFEQKLNSPEKYDHAWREIISFGWWNNANRLLPHLENGNYEKHYQKFLTDIACECDEP
jgi:hypothetical protein